MPKISFNDLLKDISSTEYKYNIKNPNWDINEPSERFYKIFHDDYGYTPADPKGDWWYKDIDKPYTKLPTWALTSPTQTNSVLLPSNTTTSPVANIVKTTKPIIDISYEQVGEATVATVATKGVFSTVSSALATAAAEVALGFEVGLKSFEAVPEFWTNLSNKIFGTDIDPSMVQDYVNNESTPMLIFEGLGYMAEDLLDAIKGETYNQGANEVVETAPILSDKGQRITVDIKTMGNSIITVDDVESIFSCGYRSAEDKARLDGYLKSAGFSQYAIRYKDNTYSEPYIMEFSIMTKEIAAEFLENPPTNIFVRDLYPVKVQNGISYGMDFNFVTGVHDFLFQNLTVVKNENQIEVYYPNTSKSPSSGYRSLLYGQGFSEPAGNYIFVKSSLNAISKPKVPTIIPTKNIGTKTGKIKDDFPEWWNKGKETISSDGKTKIRWLPVSIPNVDPTIDGTPYTQDKAQEGQLPSDDTKNMTDIVNGTEEATEPAPPSPTPPIQPIETPTPTPPIPAFGVGGNTGLAAIYNPTTAQVQAFSRWLWGTDFSLDQLKKLFQDPMQAIIGLHVLYATPTTGEAQPIQLGYINSSVSAAVVTKQYIDIDCGTVQVNEYFGDARDYSPFTQVYCYLPFIGIVELSADDVINSNLNISYRVDVLTGTSLASLKVTKSGLDAVLYTYSGNAAVQMPISSGSYLSTISSLLATAGGIAGAVVTGGALTPLAVAGATSLMHNKASVQSSGNLGANAGAMGIRKPYLLIRRQESADARAYNQFSGYPTNIYTNLGSVSGYIRVKDIKLTLPDYATKEEYAEVENMLKKGVIL